MYPKEKKNLDPVRDYLLEWFYRFAASGGIPRSWAGPDLSSLPENPPCSVPLKIEIVSHCYKYANILTYQLSSLVNFPPQNADITMTVFYWEGDTRTKEVINHFGSIKVKNLRWNWQALPEQYLMRRAIGRNLAAKNTKCDWIFFTDCDVLFRERALDKLAGKLQQNSNLLVYPRYHMVSDLLPNDDPLFRDYKEDGFVRDIDPARFYPEERTRAVGGFQITRGDAARLAGYCNSIPYYQYPVKRWRKAYEDRTFRWLLGTQGSPLDISGFYRIRHSEKGRKGKIVGVHKGG